MFLWPRKTPEICSPEDVRFFLLLCLGHEAEHEIDISRRAGTRCFSVLKSLLASREFICGVLEPLKLQKSPVCMPYSPTQQIVLKKGAKRHLNISLSHAENHIAALKIAATSSRFLRALESADKGYSAGWFVETITKLDTPKSQTIIGALDDLTPNSCHGYALDTARPGEMLSLDFFINGYYIGTSKTGGQRRDIEEIYPGFANTGFQHLIHLPPHLAGLDHLVLSVFDHSSSAPICLAKEFPNMGARNQHHTLKLIQALETAKTASSAALQAAIGEIEEAMPALQQYAAFPLGAYAQYKQLYADAPAPETTPLAEQAGLIFPGECDSLKVDRANGWFQYAAAKKTEAVLFFSDHEQQQGTAPCAPIIKTNFDYEELLTRPDYAQAFAVRPDVPALLGQTHTDIADIDAATLWLLVYEKLGNKGFCHIPQILFRASKTLPNLQQFQDAVDAHFFRTGSNAKTTLNATDNYSCDPVDHLRIDWPLDDEMPLMAIIIPMRDTLDLTRDCIYSVRATLAHPEATEIIIVDNGSSDPDTKNWLRNADAMDGIRVLLHDAPFNWSEINNAAVAASKAEYLLFLNNDTTALDIGWDTVLRGYLNRKDVGLVGARLLFEDGTIQFAGYVVNPVNIAMKEAYGEHPGKGGYNHRSRLPHASSALIGAFMGCRREVFEQAGGFDAQRFPVAYNDIDFCLTVRANGYKVLYVPAITFHHHESKTRGYDALDEAKNARENIDRETFLQKWGERLVFDPWYSEAFTMCEPTHSFLAAPKKMAIRTDFEVNSNWGGTIR